jgi:hypothetical protein
MDTVLAALQKLDDAAKAKLRLTSATTANKQVINLIVLASGQRSTLTITRSISARAVDVQARGVGQGDGFGERVGREGAYAAQPNLIGSFVPLKDVPHTSQPFGQIGEAVGAQWGNAARQSR